MSFKDFYQSELTALRQHAAVLCNRQPEMKSFIGQDVRAPDVERVMQGVSFLTARLRQTLNDEFPQITHGLMQRLWPNYLRPMPSMSVIQFDPSSRSGPARPIPRRCEVIAKPVQGINCQFQTVFDTEVLPLELYRVEHADRGKRATLKLSIKLLGEGHIGELNLQQLRLHLTGDASVTHQLYKGLLQQLASVQVRLLDGDGALLRTAADQSAHLKLKPSQIRPVGFNSEEALLARAGNPQRGYRLLHEFFVFREKFLFVDVQGLNPINYLDKELLAQARGLELCFDFSHYATPPARPRLENVKLNCTPVINLFHHKALPIPLEAGQLEYPLLPAEVAAGVTSQACEIFSVEKVMGWKPGHSSYREYTSPDSTSRAAVQESAVPAAFYSVSQHHSVIDDSLLNTIRFQVEDSDAETIAVDLLCTNRNFPGQLGTGDISLPGPGVPELLTFRSICPATASLATPQQGEHLWKLISNLSLNYLSLQNVNALKEILRTYDLPAFHDQGARLASEQLFGALHKVSYQNIDYLKRGIPIRGTRTLLEIRPKDATCEAQWFLFGSVLSHFFALYASECSFNQLHIQSSSGELWAWEALPGQQPML